MRFVDQTNVFNVFQTNKRAVLFISEINSFILNLTKDGGKPAKQI